MYDLTFQGPGIGLLDGMVDLISVRLLGFGGLVLQLLQLHTLLQSPQLEHQVDLLVALLLHHQRPASNNLQFTFAVLFSTRKKKMEITTDLLKDAQLLLKFLLFRQDFGMGGFHFFHLLSQSPNTSCN